jgi:hypothetical protein
VGKKAASAVRVAQMGVQLMREGRLTYPLADAALLKDLKGHRVPSGEVKALLADAAARLDAALPASVLPAEADGEKVRKAVTAEILRNR